MKKNLFYFLVLFTFLLLSFSAYGFSIRYHYDLIRSALMTEGFSQDAIDIAIASNAYTDIMQEPDPAEYVMDNDFIAKGANIVNFLHFDQLYNRDLVYKYYKRLIYNTYKTFQYYLSSDPQRAMTALGASLHILQDFYAHSNWADLDLASYSGIKDASYFDVMGRNLFALNLAITQNKTMTDELKAYQIYTNGNGSVPTPNHSMSHKDNWGRNFFELAYRGGYKASVEWIRLCKKWVCVDFNRPDVWNTYKSLIFSGSRDDLHTLSSYDEGTFRYLYTYAGSWSHKERWGKMVIFQDNLPNVEGIGWYEGNGSTGDIPLLGNEWYDGCVRIADQLFETQEPGILEILYLDNAGNVTVTTINEADLVVPTDLIIDQAFQFLADTFNQNTLYPVNWLSVSIPYVKDLDPGDGWFNINNEEGIAGSYSDYWPAFTVNNVLYTEALLEDRRDATTFWGVLHPLWDMSPVSLNIKLYESDPGNHKDETMDINPNSGEEEVNLVLDPDFLKTQANGVSGVYAGTDNTDYGAQINTLIKILQDFSTDPAAVNGISVLYKCSDFYAPNDNHVKPHIKLVNNGTGYIPLNELTVRYWYTTEGSQPQTLYADYAAPGSQNILYAFGSLQKQRNLADGYLDIGFTSQAGSLAPGQDTGEIQLRFNKIDWKNYNEYNDYSYRQSSQDYQSTMTITVYRNGTLIWGQEPVELAPSQYPKGIARVWTKDEAYGQNQMVTLRLFVENIGNGVLDNFDVSYFFKTENGKTPVMTVIEKYYTPGVTITLEHLDGDDYRILFKFVDVNIAPGDVYPNNSGFSIGIHYTDWSPMDDTNDRSYPGSGTFVPAVNTPVTDYDAIPAPPKAKFRKTVTVINLHASTIEDSGHDECSFYIDVDGDNVDLVTNDMAEGDDWAIGTSYNFMTRATFRLYDRDGDFPGDDDDHLGSLTINAINGIHTGKFTQDEADYTVTYRVDDYVPAPVALKMLTVRRVICYDTLYNNPSDSVKLTVSTQASPHFIKDLVMTTGTAYGNYSEHFFYSPAEGDVAIISLLYGSQLIIVKTVESADGSYTVYGTDANGYYAITYTVSTIGYRTPEVPKLANMYLLTLQKIECAVTEDDGGGDELDVGVYIDGAYAETKYRDINDGDVWPINAQYLFEKNVVIHLTDIDGDFPGDDNDSLGSAEFMPAVEENYYVVSGDGATYRVYYKVEQM